MIATVSASGMMSPESRPSEASRSAPTPGSACHGRPPRNVGLDDLAVGAEHPKVVAVYQTRSNSIQPSVPTMPRGSGRR